MSNGHEAKILTPYIHALKDVVLRLYLIDVEKMFLDWARECDFEESEELSIKDMVFLFNSIRNRR